jgi:hypothetical protein
VEATPRRFRAQWKSLEIPMFSGDEGVAATSFAEVSQ